MFHTTTSLPCTKKLCIGLTELYKHDECPRVKIHRSVGSPLLRTRKYTMDETHVDRCWGVTKTPCWPLGAPCNQPCGQHAGMSLHIPTIGFMVAIRRRKQKNQRQLTAVWVLPVNHPTSKRAPWILPNVWPSIAARGTVNYPPWGSDIAMISKWQVYLCYPPSSLYDVSAPCNWYYDAAHLPCN